MPELTLSTNRFDLYDTLIQYIQSRGRARHANSRVWICVSGNMTILTNYIIQYIHMIEENNRMHLQAVDDVRQGEVFWLGI